MQRRGREAEHREPAVYRADQVTQLRADKRSEPTRMLARHQLVPDRAVRRVVDPHHLEPFKRPHLRRHPIGCRHGLSQSPGLRRARAAARRGQHDALAERARAHR